MNVSLNRQHLNIQCFSLNVHHFLSSLILTPVSSRDSNYTSIQEMTEEPMKMKS